MTKLLCIIMATLMLVSPAIAASQHVRSYVRKDGTLVEAHRQTNPDSTRLNNWSTKGNINPYIGTTGTVGPLKPRRHRKR